MADISIIGYKSGKLQKPSATESIGIGNNIDLALGGSDELKIKNNDTNSSIQTSDPLLIATENQVAVTIGNSTSSTVTIGDNLAVSGNTVITGNLTVSGTQTVVNSSTITVDDKNLELGSVDTPTDTTADGGGITLKGATDHTILWANSTDSWDFSEHVNAASGKEFKINNVSVLNATTLGSNVVNSSLTSVGTLTALTVDNVSINGTTIGHTDDTDLITLANQSITIANNADFNIAKAGGLQIASTAVTSTAAELNLLDTASAGTVVNSKAVIYGSSGEIAAASLDISGNIDVDGTTNLDAVDIDGATQIDATVTVGADDTGYDVKFFGATSGKSLLWDESEDSLIITGDATDALKVAGGVDIDGVINVGLDDTGYDVKFFGDTASAYMQWDASADDLILGGAAGLIVPDGQLTLGSTAITSTAAEINLLDATAGSALSEGLAGGDGIIINDASDSNATKKVLLSDIATFVGTGGGSSANNALDTQSLANKESTTINSGQIVAISAASSIRGLLEADSNEVADTEVIGVATDSINANATIGTKIHSAWGKSVSVNKFEVSSGVYQDIGIGDKLYLSDTPGKCTTTAPTAENFTVYRIGYAAAASNTSTANVTVIWMPQYIASL